MTNRSNQRAVVRSGPLVMLRTNEALRLVWKEPWDCRLAASTRKKQTPNRSRARRMCSTTTTHNMCVPACTEHYYRNVHVGSFMCYSSKRWSAIELVCPRTDALRKNSDFYDWLQVRLQLRLCLHAKQVQSKRPAYLQRSCAHTPPHLRGHPL